MTAEPFTPIGDRPRWQMVADLVERTETDKVVTYEDAAALLDLRPIKDRQLIQQAIRTAAWHHQQDTGRAIEPVTNVGYRIVKSPENLRLAHGQQKRSKRALKKAHRAVTLTDRKGLSLEERRQFDQSGQALSALIDFTRRLDLRQRHMEKALEAVATQTVLNKDQGERTSEEVSQLRARLERLESKRGHAA